MKEVTRYPALYKEGLFIEADPNVFLRLKKNLKRVNSKYNTNYIALNKLVTSINNGFILKFGSRQCHTDFIYIRKN